MRFGIIVLILLSGLAQAQDKKREPSPSEQVLFSIKNSSVYMDEFLYLYKKNHSKPDDFTEEKINEHLNLLINFKLKIAEAKRRGLDTTKAFTKEFNTYKEELKKPYRADTDDLDRLTKETYDRLKEEVKAAHLLITLKQDAIPADTLIAYTKITNLRNRIVKGEDFEKLAREFSDDPSARTNGGVLGYFTALQMVYPFEEAAFRTNVGEISPVIRTRFGYHIIKVIDRRASQGEVEVSHILLRVVKGNETKVRNSIFEIYDQLKGGRNWDELCREYSEDTNTKNSGGRLRPFGIGVLASVPEFEQMAFSLKSPGDYSDPFQSGIGWHIIRLEKKISLQSFQEMEPSLKRRVGRDERLSVSRSISLEKRKMESGFTEDGNVRVQIFSLADSSLVKGQWHYGGRDSLLRKTLFAFHTEKTQVRDFFTYLSAQKANSGAAPSTYMKQLYDRYIEEKVNEQEERRLLSDNPEYRMLLNEYREGILLFEIMEKEVWNKSSDDTTGQRKYYLEHLDRFKAGNRVEARIFATSDKSFMEEIKKKIQTGDTLREGEIKKFKSVTNWKAYERSESQVIDQINWVPGLQDREIKGTYYLVEISRLVPPGTRSFEEARALVISEYQDFLEKEWLKKLKQNFSVRINKKGKMAVISALRK